MPPGTSSLRKEKRAVAVPPVAGVTCQKRWIGLGGSPVQVLYGFEPPAAEFAVVLPKAPLRPARRAVSTPSPSTKVNGPRLLFTAWLWLCRIWPLFVYAPVSVRTKVVVSSTAPAFTARAPLTVAAPPSETAAPVLASVRLLKVKAGIVCAPDPLKATVLPVTVYAFVPGVNAAATPIVPEEASVRAPVELLVRLL
jgi:hypothetical protein